ncbi:hypothetical protein [Streptomyces spongiae]|uniref:Uncharacterized protein n=1 Tax=Streptomyces spongiae TaxID=565072 RepID=A0A5N8XWM8_9ACTN|nr:hypothetical protein [Streptomyces spongiae]MPY63672.1 hypothetical protein [Streptomyces spongiae]
MTTRDGAAPWARPDAEHVRRVMAWCSERNSVAWRSAGPDRTRLVERIGVDYEERFTHLAGEAED